MSTPKERKLSPANRQASLETLTILGVSGEFGALGLWMYADEYLAAAKAVPSTNKLNLVRSALTCHAIELLLKASLSVDGVRLLTLSEAPLGHNLEKLLATMLSEPTGRSAQLELQHIDAINNAAKYHDQKIFEYPAPAEALAGYPHLPDIPILTNAAELLLNHLEEPCKNRI